MWYITFLHNHNFILWNLSDYLVAIWVVGYWHLHIIIYDRKPEKLRHWTFLVQKRKYSGISRSIPSLLIARLFASLRQQQPWYCSCKIDKWSFSCEIWLLSPFEFYEIIDFTKFFCVAWNELSTTRVKISLAHVPGIGFVFLPWSRLLVVYRVDGKDHYSHHA